MKLYCDMFIQVFTDAPESCFRSLVVKSLKGLQLKKKIKNLVKN